MNGATQLDEAQLATLRMLRNGQLLGGLIRTYRSQTEQQLVEIQTALAARDGAGVASIAHSLKSASFSLGATRMGQLSTALESAAIQRDLDQCQSIATALQDSYGALLPELAKEEQT